MTHSAQTERPKLTRLEVSNFRSLADVEVPLGDLTVLVGPNGSGKTNVLNVLRFLAATARFDLVAAIDQWGGFEHVRRSGVSKGSQKVKIKVSGQLTKHASEKALDEYELVFGEASKGLTRSEVFTFKRTSGRGRRITVKNKQVAITETLLPFGSSDGGTTGATTHGPMFATAQTTGLSTLPRLDSGEGISTLANFLLSVRVLEPDMREARRPSRMIEGRLSDDASNLASALYYLKQADEEAFAGLENEMRYCLPGLRKINFSPMGGAGRAVAVSLTERGITSPVELADASFGTVRMLVLLTALHEPNPPPLMAIEEVDHGLHPYALDILVDRLRAASEKTQLLITTHSPTLVSQLKSNELVVCGRDAETSASVIPCRSSDELEEAKRKSGLSLGELWFAGSLGGVPDGGI